jgi:putative membrane protein
MADAALKSSPGPGAAVAYSATAVAEAWRAFYLLCAVAAIGLAWSGIGPVDRLTWWLEVAPVIVAVPLLGATLSRFPLTPMIYLLVAVHAAILMLGGHYTYAKVPLGFWLQDLLDFSRNPYDRIGHFAQGFVPAMVARELLLRHTPLRRGGWLFTIVAGMCLAISACYEFIEWWSALIGGGSAEAFLGTQGDVWDTQWDMFLALCGAIAAQLLLAGAHDRALRRLGVPLAR